MYALIDTQVPPLFQDAAAGASLLQRMIEPYESPLANKVPCAFTATVRTGFCSHTTKVERQQFSSKVVLAKDANGNKNKNGWESGIDTRFRCPRYIAPHRMSRQMETAFGRGIFSERVAEDA